MAGPVAARRVLGAEVWVAVGSDAKGMAEAVVMPIMAAIVNGIAHAIGHRFRTLPVTPEQILRVLG